MRFHLDENVDHAVAAGLRARGIDVTTSTDAQLISASDDAQLDYASSQMRVLVTHDGPLLGSAVQRLQHAGVAFCQKGSLSVGDMIRALVRMNDAIDSTDMAGRIEYLRR
jgi:predicted nuclease of predicted toxin-antitoxin system